MLRIEKDIENQKYKNLQSELQELKTSWLKDKIQVFAFLSAVLTFIAVLGSYLYLSSTGYFSKPEIKQQPAQKTNLSYEMKYLYALQDSLNTKQNVLQEKTDSLQYEIISKEITLKGIDDRTEKMSRENNLISNSYFLLKDSKDILIQNKYITEITAMVNRYDEIIDRIALIDSAAYDQKEYLEVYQPARIQVFTTLAFYRRTKEKAYLDEIDKLLPVLDKFIFPIELSLLQSETERKKLQKAVSVNSPDSI